MQCVIRPGLGEFADDADERSVWMLVAAACSLLLLTAQGQPGAITFESLNKQLSSDGVFVRQWDDQADTGQIWRPRGGLNFVSASLLTKKFPYMYSTLLGGVIMANDFVLNKTQSPVNCACSCDCGSDQRSKQTGCAKHIHPGGINDDDNPGTPGWHAFYKTVDEMRKNLDPKP